MPVNAIGTLVDCVIDRPMGSLHPKHKDIRYPVNYGYVEGVFAGDGEEQDVYVLGVDEPLHRFSGRVIAVYHRFDDVEDKWIVAPDGMKLSEERILEEIRFQEQYYSGRLYMSHRFPCRCCGYYTLEGGTESDTAWEICPVCYWENDVPGGREEEYSGANHMTLAEGRRNYRTCGACDPKLQPYVRPPREEERHVEV